MSDESKVSIDRSNGIPGGRGGTIYPAKPGEVRNPSGRGPGKTPGDWLSILATSGCTLEDLKAILKDPKAEWTKRAAADRAIATIERQKLSQFQPAIDGRKTLEDLEADGIDTSCVKKLKVKKKLLGTREELIESEIEIHKPEPRIEFKDTTDRTDGPPATTTNINATVTVQPHAPSDAFLRRCKSRPADTEAGSN